MQRQVNNQIKKIVNQHHSADVADGLFLLISGYYFGGDFANFESSGRQKTLEVISAYTTSLREIIEENILRLQSARAIAFWIDIAEEMLKKGDFHTAAIIQERLDYLKTKANKHPNLKKAFDSLDENKLAELGKKATFTRLTKLNQYTNRKVSIPFIQALTGFKENIRAADDLTAKVTQVSQQNKKDFGNFISQTRREVVKQREIILLVRYQTLLAKLHKYRNKYANAKSEVNFKKRAVCDSILHVLESNLNLTDKTVALNKIIQKQEGQVKHHLFHQYRASDPTIIEYAKEMQKLLSLLEINANAKKMLLDEKVKLERSTGILFVSPGKVAQTSPIENQLTILTNAAIQISNQITDPDLQMILNTITKQSHLIVTSNESSVVSKATVHLTRILNEIKFNPELTLLKELTGELASFTQLASQKVAELFNQTPTPPTS